MKGACMTGLVAILTHSSCGLTTISTTILPFEGCQSETPILTQETVNNCPISMYDGQTCAVTCPEDYGSVGFFTCSRGVLVGDSVCVEQSKRAVSLVTKMAGTMQISMDVSPAASNEALKENFKSGLANVLQVKLQDVVKLYVSGFGSMDSGLRRLREFQRKWYEVAFEVLPLNSSVAKEVLKKARAIFVSESNESRAFRQSVELYEDVHELKEVVVKVPVRAFQDEMLVQVEAAYLEESRNLPYSMEDIVIGVAAVAIAGMLCLGLGMLLWQKRLTKPAPREKCEPGCGQSKGECLHLEHIVVHMPTILENIAVANGKELEEAGKQNVEVYLSRLEEAKMAETASCTLLENLPVPTKDPSEAGPRPPPPHTPRKNMS